MGEEKFQISSLEVPAEINEYELESEGIANE